MSLLIAPIALVAETSLPSFCSTPDVKKYLSSKTPCGVCAYLPFATRLTVEICISILSATANSYSKSLAYRVFGSFDDLNSHVFSNISGDSIRDILVLVEQRDSLVLNMCVPTDIVSECEINDARLIIFDRDKFDKFVASIFENQEIVREQARIEVCNGTGIGGLASKYARRIKNFGGDVIRVSNKSGDYERTIIFTPDISKFSKTISRLEIVFPDAQIVEDYPPFTVTGDITILLAEDAIDS